MLTEGADLPAGLVSHKGVWAALATGYVSATGGPAIDHLLTRSGKEHARHRLADPGGAASGGIVEKAGVLDRLIGPLMAAARSVGALMATLVGAAFATNALASDQYIAVVLAGRMFRGAFVERRAAPRWCCRALGATVTSPLSPWNRCGAYIAATSASPTSFVPTFFVPFSFFNLLNPLIPGRLRLSLSLHAAVRDRRSPADPIKEHPDVPGTPH